MTSAVLRLLARSPWARSARVKRVAQALFVRAALQRGDGVAIGIEERLGLGRPGDGPFHRALAVAIFGAAEEGARRDGRLAFDLAARKSVRPPGNFSVSSAGVPLSIRAGVAFPADFDAAEQIGLGLRHAIEPRRREMHVVAENLAGRA